MWDFNNPDQRKRALKLIRDTEPVLVVGSPMCALFSPLQGLNWHKDPVRFRKAYKQAVDHLLFCLEIYKLQVEGGRYFLHEHPARATSWQVPEMVKFIAENDLHLVNSVMCAFGMKIEDQHVLKPTKWLTNCDAIAMALSVGCDGTHSHLPLIGGTRSRQAQVYPVDLCRTIVKALRRQLKADADAGAAMISLFTEQSIEGQGRNDCDHVNLLCVSGDGVHTNLSYVGDGARMPQSGSDCATGWVPPNLDILRVEEDECYHDPWDGDGNSNGDWAHWKASDDVKGGELPPALVHAARLKELAYLRNRCVYRYASTAAAIQSVGRRPSD